MNQDFKRIAVVNRGEPAMRFINAVREWNERSKDTLRTIALFTSPDRRALFVREADEAIDIGPASHVTSRGVRRSAYLDLKVVRAALERAHADAVWLGWGFSAEDAEFARMCEDLGLAVIGSTSESMKRLGDKISAKRLATEAGLSVVPWSDGPVDSFEQAQKHAERLGYPIVVKATAGEGGRGIQRVERAADLETAFIRARGHALDSTSDPRVFVERCLEGVRQVEVQVVADHHGGVWTLGVRDGSIQRNFQKVIEESPSPVLDHEQQGALEVAAVRLTKAGGFRGVGSVEFLYDPRQRESFFLEVNARLQIEHAVTELTTGLDLVGLQLHVARGGRLEGQPKPQTGHAIEVRLTAEDPETGFSPSHGLIERLRLAGGPGIRVDVGYAEGDDVAAEFDATIGKIIAHAPTREEAVAHLSRALAQSVVVLRGGTSNKSFLLGLLRRPEVRGTEVDTSWLDGQIASGKHLPREHAEIALLCAAVESYDAELAAELASFHSTAVRGRPEVGDEIGRKIELSLFGVGHSLHVSRLSMELYRVDVAGHRIELQVEKYGPIERRLILGADDYRVHTTEQGSSYLIDVEGVTHRVSRGRGELVRSPAPAVVVDVLVREGDTVAVGDPIVVLEAMKMEMTVDAKRAGQVRELHVISGVQVQAGAPLALIEPRQDFEAAKTSTSTDLSRLAHSPPKVWSSTLCNLTELRSLVLGYDARISELKGSTDAGSQALPQVDDPAMIALEDDILRTFVDLSSLARRRFEDSDEPDFGRHSAEEYLFTFLRDIEAAPLRLPESFLEALRRSLVHFGVSSLERTEALEESLFRIFKAHQRIDDQIAPILSILQTRLDNVDRFVGKADEDFRSLLDRLIGVTRGRFPGLNDLARELRYDLFDKPLQEGLALKAYREAEVTLRRLVDHPHGADRPTLIQTLVDCPQPLKSFFSSRLPGASSTMRRTMLEVLMRRYYRIRRLAKLELLERDGVTVALTEYELDGQRFRVVSALILHEQLSQVFQVLAPFGESCPEEVELALDVYVFKSSDLDAPESAVATLRSGLDGVRFPHRLRRVLVAFTGPSSARGMRNEQHFTFRQTDDGFVEDKLYRGWHILLGRRLNLWRLSTNFEIERVSTGDSIHLFHAVGRTNAKDERLVAFAEVRDLTQLRDERGKLLRLPSLERIFYDALAGIRRFQAQRPTQSRLQWNRVHLFIWPRIDLTPEELSQEIHRLSEETEGLGLERVLLQGSYRDPATGEYKEQILDVTSPTGRGLSIRYRDPPKHAMQPLSEYTQKVVELRQRGLMYPYELVAMLTPERADVKSNFPRGSFVEHDLGPDGKLAPVDRPRGMNTANIVVGVITSFTAKYPDGMARVAMLGDPSRGLGSLAEPECKRIIASLDFAEERRLPVEWYAVSAGAKISMDSGTENMDWISAVLRRIITFTQAGHELNVLVCGVTVGAQPYWNAEATMLMHTRGILVMTADSSMVLTGKRALDYSGGVSAEDNEGIGGFERIMGPNGQAQYFARDIPEACQILLRHYDHSYILPGERFPRQAITCDPVDRDPGDEPHGQGFATVGEIFREATNPGRKKPFDIRKVMQATIDRDHEPLERWATMKDAETAVVWDAHIGGYPVCLLGIESQPVPRRGQIPADGPSSFTSGTLFPRSSKKVARAINATSGNRPLVVLANLSGFDGSPESMRELQLEYGAEIGRAVVNFRGPIVFTVISRYHGGAFVVFSAKLNERMEIAALEGTHASVIGGAPAAAVVFAGQVHKRTNQDPRIAALQAELKQAERGQRAVLRSRLEKLSKVVYAEKMREVADEFDTVHSVHRALKVGSVHKIIEPSRLRSYVIDAIARGMERELAQST